MIHKRDNLEQHRNTTVDVAILLTQSSDATLTKKGKNHIVEINLVDPTIIDINRIPLTELVTLANDPDLNLGIAISDLLRYSNVSHGITPVSETEIKEIKRRATDNAIANGHAQPKHDDFMEILVQMYEENVFNLEFTEKGNLNPQVISNAILLIALRRMNTKSEYSQDFPPSPFEDSAINHLMDVIWDGSNKKRTSMEKDVRNDTKKITRKEPLFAAAAPLLSTDFINRLLTENVISENQLSEYIDTIIQIQYYLTLTERLSGIDVQKPDRNGKVRTIQLHLFMLPEGNELKKAYSQNLHPSCIPVLLSYNHKLILALNDEFNNWYNHKIKPDLLLQNKPNLQKRANALYGMGCNWMINSLVSQAKQIASERGNEELQLSITNLESEIEKRYAYDENSIFKIINLISISAMSDNGLVNFTDESVQTVLEFFQILERINNTYKLLFIQLSQVTTEDTEIEEDDDVDDKSSSNKMDDLSPPIQQSFVDDNVVEIAKQLKEYEETERLMQLERDETREKELRKKAYKSYPLFPFGIENIRVAIKMYKEYLAQINQNNT